MVRRDQRTKTKSNPRGVMNNVCSATRKEKSKILWDEQDQNSLWYQNDADFLKQNPGIRKGVAVARIDLSRRAGIPSHQRYSVDGSITKNTVDLGDKIHSSRNISKVPLHAKQANNMRDFTSSLEELPGPSNPLIRAKRNVKRQSESYRKSFDNPMRKALLASSEKVANVPHTHISLFTGRVPDYGFREQSRDRQRHSVDVRNFY